MILNFKYERTEIWCNILLILGFPQAAQYPPLQPPALVQLLVIFSANDAHMFSGLSSNRDACPDHLLQQF